MHEASITESLLALALEKAGEAKAGKITRINLVVGELAGVEPSCVKFYFDFVSKNTLADGAALNFTMKPARLKCRKCEKEFSPTEHNWSCPACREPSGEIISGREFYMESLEVE